MCVSMETPIPHSEMSLLVTTRMVRIRLRATSVAATPTLQLLQHIC